MTNLNWELPSQLRPWKQRRWNKALLSRKKIIPSYPHPTATHSCLSVCLSVLVSNCLSIRLSVCLSVCLSVLVSVYLSVSACLSVRDVTRPLSPLFFCCSSSVGRFIVVVLWFMGKGAKIATQQTFRPWTEGTRYKRHLTRANTGRAGDKG